MSALSFAPAGLIEATNSKPRAHALGYNLSPLRGDLSFDAGDRPYSLSPLRGDLSFDSGERPDLSPLDSEG